ncbi:terpene synthase family, metal-binding domain protein [Rhizoctonia solani 123E]|uniref:Terpene synthase n=2 Tax=Rhizoctonia solani AG-3 TaxID=1086053 RepID=A0A074RXT7_9AGAM|nr:terpene synthase family, metal-binding domain protein [Rhizoctonia solani 123E]
MSEFPTPQLVSSATLPDHLQLPDVSTYTGKVFGLKINPHHQQAEIESYAWFDSYDIHSGSRRQKFFDSGFGLMTAMCYPDCDSAHLRVVTDFVLWLFSFDDLTDAGGLDSIQGMKRAVGVTMNVLRDPTSPPPKFKVAAILHSYFNRMCQDASPATIRHFVDAVDFYTQAVFQQKVNRSTDRTPSIEEYIQLRRDTSAMKIAWAVLEYSLDMDLPDEVLNHPIVKELADAGNDILTWANDIYSFPIEFARGDTHNFVCVAMEHNKLSLEDAIEYVNQLTRKRLDEYVEIKAKLPSFGPGIDEQVAQYLLGIEYCVQGFIDWTFVTPRYFGDEAAKVKETGIVNLMAPVALDAHVVVEA